MTTLASSLGLMCTVFDKRPIDPRSMTHSDVTTAVESAVVGR